MTTKLKSLFFAILVACIGGELNAQFVYSPDNTVTAVIGSPVQIPQDAGTHVNGWTPSNAHWAAPLIYRSQRYPNDGSGTFPFNEYGELVIQGTSSGSPYNRGISFLTWDGSGSAAKIRLRINESGDIGMGTHLPFGNLHIRNPNDGSDQYGGLRFFAAKSASEAVLSYQHYNTIMGFRRKGLWISGSGNGSSYVRSNMLMTDEGVFFGMSDGDSDPETNKVLSIMNNGNVGIGTDTPDAALTVKGDVHTREVKVDLEGAVAPDFVFEDDYELPTLEETEAYILTNKHLPEIPSASEMQDNGLELKAMNLKLLQKMEELTLHLIEQNKRLGLLEEKNSKLEREMATFNKE